MRAVIGKNKPGTVLIISSIFGIRGNYGVPLYCATKFALIGFVRSLAETDKREGVCLMVFCPGLTHTHLWSDRPGTMKDFFYTPQNAMNPIEVAEMMVEMCQQKTKYCGGVVLETSLYGTRVIPEWNVNPPKHLPLGIGTGETYGHANGLLKNERGVNPKRTPLLYGLSNCKSQKSKL